MKGESLGALGGLRVVEALALDLWALHIKDLNKSIDEALNIKSVGKYSTEQIKTPFRS